MKKLFIITVVAFFVLLFPLSSSSVHAQQFHRTIPASKCWQFSCNGTFPYSYTQCLNISNPPHDPPVNIYDSYKHWQGTVGMDVTGATNGCMAIYGEFISNNNTWQNVTLNIEVDGGPNDVDYAQYIVQYQWAANTIFVSQMVGFEGHGRDCINLAFVLLDNRGNITNYFFPQYCPS